MKLQHPKRGCIPVAFGANQKYGNPKIQLLLLGGDNIFVHPQQYLKTNNNNIPPLLTLAEDEVSVVDDNKRKMELIVTREGGLSDLKCLTVAQLNNPNKVSPRVVFGIYQGNYYIHNPHTISYLLYYTKTTGALISTNIVVFFFLFKKNSKTSPLFLSFNSPNLKTKQNKTKQKTETFGEYNRITHFGWWC